MYFFFYYLIDRICYFIFLLFLFCHILADCNFAAGNSLSVYSRVDVVVASGYSEIRERLNAIFKEISETLCSKYSSILIFF